MPSLARRFLAEGHLIDSGLLTRMLNIIVDEGADYTVISFSMGKVRTDPSHLELEVRCGREQQLDAVTGHLVNQGCYEKEVQEAVVRPAPKDSCVPGRLLRNDQSTNTGLPPRPVARGGRHANGRGRGGKAGRAGLPPHP